MAYGQNSNIGISFQNSYGTSLTNSVYWMPHVSDGLGLNIEQLTSESMRGINDPGDSYAGKKTVDGDLEIEFQPIPAGVLLQGLMGAPSTVTSGAYYTHTFNPRSSDFDDKCAGHPITYHQYFDIGSANLLYDLNVSGMEIGIAAGELLKMTASFVGGQHTQVANISATYPVDKHFSWDVGSVSIDGVSKTEIIDLTVTIDDALEAMHTLNGSKYPARIKRTGFRSIEVSGTLKFDDQVEYQNFLAQNEYRLVASFRGTTEVQSGYYEELIIDIPSLRYSEIKPSAGGVGEMDIGFTGMAKYNAGSGTAITITLANTQAAY